MKSYCLDLIYCFLSRFLFGGKVHHKDSQGMGKLSIEQCMYKITRVLLYETTIVS